MQKGYYKKLSYEDKFDRKYACWTYNHDGWLKCKTANRRTARRKIKIDTKNEIKNNQYDQ